MNYKFCVYLFIANFFLFVFAAFLYNWHIDDNNIGDVNKGGK